MSSSLNSSIFAFVCTAAGGSKQQHRHGSHATKLGTPVLARAAEGQRLEAQARSFACQSACKKDERHFNWRTWRVSITLVKPDFSVSRTSPRVPRAFALISVSNACTTVVYT